MFKFFSLMIIGVTLILCLNEIALSKETGICDWCKVDWDQNGIIVSDNCDYGYCVQFEDKNWRCIPDNEINYTCTVHEDDDDDDSGGGGGGCFIKFLIEPAVVESMPSMH
jgi:hypothetical protein